MMEQLNGYKRHIILGIAIALMCVPGCMSDESFERLEAGIAEGQVIIEELDARANHLVSQMEQIESTARQQIASLQDQIDDLNEEADLLEAQGNVAEAVKRRNLAEAYVRDREAATKALDDTLGKFNDELAGINSKRQTMFDRVGGVLTDLAESEDQQAFWTKIATNLANYAFPGSGLLVAGLGIGATRRSQQLSAVVNNIDASRKKDAEGDDGAAIVLDRNSLKQLNRSTGVQGIINKIRG